MGEVEQWDYFPAILPAAPERFSHLFDDIGQLLDLYRLVIEQGFPLGH